MKINVDFSATIQVDFVNPDLAKEFFLESDWKETFYDFENLLDLASDLIAHDFIHRNDVSTCYIEGVGKFERMGNVWSSTKKEYGTIQIKESDQLAPINCNTTNETIKIDMTDSLRV